MEWGKILIELGVAVAAGVIAPRLLTYYRPTRIWLKSPEHPWRAALVPAFATSIITTMVLVHLLSPAPPAGSGVPAGTVVAWAPSDKTAPIPIDGSWVLCGTAGTPSLDHKFLMGVSAEADIGQTGGTATIPDDGGHNHGGGTGDFTGFSKGFVNYGPIAGHDTEFMPHYKIADSGKHNHGGENRPPFYTVLFLCKVK